jgi:hypothetical protein
MRRPAATDLLKVTGNTNCNFLHAEIIGASLLSPFAKNYISQCLHLLTRRVIIIIIIIHIIIFFLSGSAAQRGL